MNKVLDKLLEYYPDCQFKLYHKEYEVSTGEGEVDWFKPYVTLDLYVNRYSGFHFSLSIPNRSYNGKNIFKLGAEALKVLVTRELKLDRRLGE